MPLPRTPVGRSAAAGVLTVLPPIPDGFSSFAFDINDRGQIVGDSGAADRYHAVRWYGGALTDLGPAVQNAPTPRWWRSTAEGHAGGAAGSGT